MKLLKGGIIIGFIIKIIKIIFKIIYKIISILNLQYALFFVMIGLILFLTGVLEIGSFFFYAYLVFIGVAVLFGIVLRIRSLFTKKDKE